MQRSKPSLYCSIGRPRDVKPAPDLSQPGAISLSRLFLCIHQHSTTKHWLKRFCRELLMQRNPEVVNTKSSFWYCHQTRVLKFYCWRWNISFNFLNFWGHARLEILTQAHNNAMLVLLIAEPSTSPTHNCRVSMSQTSCPLAQYSLQYSFWQGEILFWIVVLFAPILTILNETIAGVKEISPRV